MAELIKNVEDVFTEINSLFPDSILFGALLLYLLTQNVAYGVLTIFIIEIIGSHKIISWLMFNVLGHDKSRVNISNIKKCGFGFKNVDVRARLNINTEYPSYGVFSMISVFTYLGISMIEFSETLKNMGNDWYYRSVVSYFFTITLAILFIMYNMSCINSTELITAVLFGIIIGSIFYYINKSLFGLESMNFLGLPYIVSKETNGSPIYICINKA